MRASDTPPLSAAELRHLLFGRCPKAFLFGYDQNRSERRELMASVPADVQRAALKAMLETLGEAFDLGDQPERDLLYYMPTGDEELTEGGEERGYSPDWQIAVYEDERGWLCDLNGWPGDADCGTGVYWSRADPDALHAIFTNGDQHLDPVWAEHGAVIAEFEEHRARTIEDDI